MREAFGGIRSRGTNTPSRAGCDVGERVWGLGLEGLFRVPVTPLVSRVTLSGSLPSLIRIFLIWKVGMLTVASEGDTGYKVKSCW